MWEITRRHCVFRQKQKGNTQPERRAPVMRRE